MKILVADDHLIVRRGFQYIVAGRPDWSVAGEAADADGLFETLRRSHFDVLVLDLSLGARNALEFLGQLRAEFPLLPILILASDGEEPYAMRALRAGAHGFIQKDSSAQEFLMAIDRVGNGGRYISPAVTELLADEVARGSMALQPHDRLSSREFEVFRSIAHGHSLTDIAGRLNLSVKTVSTYRSRILMKTGFRSNADIIAYAIRNQLV
ncbi:MAG TPA: response regulator transcription factor [Thermoanaerobaculia bacterium]|nr:response regulator transcription factor [Thermoanaerobaculia bacterium]